MPLYVTTSAVWFVLSLYHSTRCGLLLYTVVCVSVCLCVGHIGEPYKNRRNI